MSNTLLKSTIILAVVTLLGRLIGLLRNIFLTNQFGIGAETDAFLMAFTIPMALFMIIPGAASAVFIPGLKKYFTNTAEHMNRRQTLFRRTTTLVFIFTLLASIVAMIFADPLTSLLAPNFDADKQALTAELLKIMMPCILLIALVAIFSSVLNAHFDFLSPSIGTVVSGLMVIVAIVILGPTVGIHSAAWGVTVGYAIFAVMLIIPLWRRSYRLGFDLRVKRDTDMKNMGVQFMPILFGMAVTQLYLIVEKILASGLGDAGVTSLALANTIVQMPIAVFVGSMTMPLFTTMSEYAQQSRLGDLANVVRKGFRIQCLLLLPITVGLMAMGTDFVRLFYDYGANVSEEGINMTAWALIFYAVGIVGWAGRDLLTRAFYALQSTRTPVVTGLISMLFYVPFALVFMPGMSEGGLALSYSLITYINLLLLSIILGRKIGRIYNAQFWLTIVKGVIGAGVMLLVIVALLPVLSTWPNILRTIVLVGIGAAVYGVMLIVLREPTVRDMLDKLLRRVKRAL